MKESEKSFKGGSVLLNNHQYRFSRGKEGYVTFDSKGYIVDAKGFGALIWNCNPNVDKELVGKHVDELAEMLEKSATSREVYLEFEVKVHLELLKNMLQNTKLGNSNHC